MDTNKKFTECKTIKAALADLKNNDEDFSELIKVLSEERKKETKLIVPMTEEEIQVEDEEEPETFASACSFRDKDGLRYIAAFTGLEDFNMNNDAVPCEVTISEMMLTVTLQGYAGVILNPGTDNVFIPEEIFMKL